jgi:hypothetical protein
LQVSAIQWIDSESEKAFLPTNSCTHGILQKEGALGNQAMFRHHIVQTNEKTIMLVVQTF